LLEGQNSCGVFLTYVCEIEQFERDEEEERGQEGGWLVIPAIRGLTLSQRVRDNQAEHREKE
jgi:hypothetical protein